jgi:uncharacterized GH25 family protein
MKANFRAKLILLAFVLLLSRVAMAHEYWLEPDKFFLAPHEKTAVHLFVGEGLKKDEERPFQLARASSFKLYSLDTIFDLKDKTPDETPPFYTFSQKNPGNYTLVLERSPAYIKIDAKKFEDYLRDEGLEHIIDERKKLGESLKEGRERYSRYIKSILQVGDKQDLAFNKQPGFGLRIYSVQNPYAKKIGDTLECWVMFGNKSVANKTIFADNREGETVLTQKVQTDANGGCKVKLDRKGTWLIRLVIMQRCQKDCAETDWESFWGAYSFGVK